MKTLRFKYFQNNKRYNPETFIFQFIPEMSMELINGNQVVINQYETTLHEFLQEYGSSNYDVFFYMIDVIGSWFITIQTSDGPELAMRTQHQPARIHAIVLRK